MLPSNRKQERTLLFSMEVVGGPIKKKNQNTNLPKVQHDQPTENKRTDKRENFIANLFISYSILPVKKSQV